MAYDDIDPDGPSPEDLERFGDEHKDCPTCGASIYDQIEMCPHCGHAFVDADTTSQKPLWWTIAFTVVVIAFLWLVF